MNDTGAASASRPSISMLGWALNEEENVAAYIERAEQFLRAVSDDFELVFIDDGSTDRTWDIATQYQATRPWLRLYQNDRNRGTGYSTRRAIELASKDYLFWQTVDWAYDIELLGRSLHLLKRYDVLQGVRVQSLWDLWHLDRRSDNVQKALVSVCNYLLIRLLFGLPLHDYQNVTVYPRRFIQSVVLESGSAFTNPECLLKAWWNGATFKEVPVPFIRRSKGIAKGTRPRAILAAVRDVFYWWHRWMIAGRRDNKATGHVVSWQEEFAPRVDPATS